MIQKRTTSTGKTRWIGRYRTPAGRERSKTFDTRRQATAWVEERRREIRRHEHIDPADQDTTVAEWVDHWARRATRERTRELYLSTAAELGPIADIPLPRLTRGDVDAWHRQLTRGRPWRGGRPLAESTARDYVMRLAAAMKSAAEDGLITRSPVRVPRKVESTRVRVTDVPTLEDIDAIISLVECGGGHRSTGRGEHVVMGPNLTVADMIRVAVGTGMRVSEIGGLVVGDIDFLRRSIHVEQQLSRTGGRREPLKTTASRRTIPVADDLVSVLDAAAAGKGPGEFVFTSSRGAPISKTSANSVAAGAARTLGLPWTFHSFRHYYASRLIAERVPVNVVQAMLGHSSASTTLDVYAHLFPNAEDVARAAIAGAVSGRGIHAGSPAAAGAVPLR